MRKKFLIFGSPLLEREEEREVLDSMRKSWLGTGPKVKAFENAFSSYKNVPYTAAVNSCTAALHLSCLSLGLKPGDEVITTAMTFCATINAIIHSGATPVLADIDPSTLNIDPNEIERKITPRTKAILVVHFAGSPCEMDAIISIAQRHHLKIIEDCAHAIETEYHGKKAGTMGDLGCFSFYSTKNITTGEGGMVISQNPELIQSIKVMALHGLNADAWQRFSDKGYKHYLMTHIGFKYNMMDLQAAIGIHQLNKVNRFWKRRAQIWKFYQDRLKHLPVILPTQAGDDIKHGYHLFTLRINPEATAVSRDDFLEEMTKRKIGVGVHYRAIPEHPYYQQTFGWKTSDFPHAFKYGSETVSIPISPKLTNRDIEDVVEAVSDILNP